RIALVNTGAVEGHDAGGRARETRIRAERVAPLLILVAEAAVLVLAALHVGVTKIDGALGDVNAGVARGAQGHDLTNGNRDVGVRRVGPVTPTAFFVLRPQDQPDGPVQFLFQLFLELSILHHSGGLRLQNGAETA